MLGSLALNCPQCGAPLQSTAGAGGATAYDCHVHGFVAVDRDGIVSLVEAGGQHGSWAAAVPSSPRTHQLTALDDALDE